jgi:hypothetical protein
LRIDASAKTQRCDRDLRRPNAARGNATGRAFLNAAETLHIPFI